MAISISEWLTKKGEPKEIFILGFFMVFIPIMFYLAGGFPRESSEVFLFSRAGCREVFTAIMIVMFIFGICVFCLAFHSDHKEEEEEWTPPPPKIPTYILFKFTCDKCGWVLDRDLRPNMRCPICGEGHIKYDESNKILLPPSDS